MNSLSLESINSASPYLVTKQTESDFLFETEYGVEYKVGFMEDTSIWDEGAYQFYIINFNGKSSPRDTKVKDTILSLIDAFFDSNPQILLYICETGDDKQAARNRLFTKWLNEPKCVERYFYKNACIISEGVDNYFAIVVQRINPELEIIAKQFEEYASLMSEKPE